VGSTVTFTATAVDPNLDNYYLAICKTSAVTAGTATYPTCDGGKWPEANPTAVTSGAEATETYTTLIGDSESNNWYAFVCDGNGSPGLCSSVGSSDSPFKVNHAPTYGWVTTTDTGDGTIAPGDTVKFTLLSVDVDDSDVDTLQDWVYMHICTNDTTSYNYSTDTCVSGTTICDSSATYTTNPVTCNDTGGALTSVPTAHDNYNYKMYLEDSHGFAGTGVGASQVYTVIEVDPVLGAWTTTDELSIGVGGSDVMSFSVAISDDNGDNDTYWVDGVFWDDSANSGALENNCSADENNCYLQAECTQSSVSTPTGAGTKTAMGTDKDLSADCEVTVWFNANASSDWEFHVNVIDSPTLFDAFADTNVNKAVAALSGIGVKSGEDTITYGTLALGAVSSVDTVTIENLGNQTNDTLISGADMCTDYPTCSGAQIDSTQQEFNPDTNTWTWGAGGDAGYALVNVGALGTTTATGCVNRDMVVRNSNSSGADSDEPFYHAIKIPVAQDSGSYTGVNTFTTTAGSTCDTEPLYNSYD
jgi:hypothetical protein